MLPPLAAHLVLLSLATATLSAPSPEQLGAISILAADNLITNDTVNTSAAVLLSSGSSWFSASRSCESLNETLWSPAKQSFTAGLNSSLAYEVYSGRFPSDQLFWVAREDRTAVSRAPLCQAITVKGTAQQINCYEQLPALCTQSAPASNITFADTSTPFQVAQKTGSQTLVGYRDFLTFRFMGVRFAAEPERFTYSSVYNGTGTSDALDPAPECLQAPGGPGNGSTDCLFLNIWTTLLPDIEKSAKKDLKPVMVYIYGGGYTSGSASNPTNDGGNLAGRGDVVVVDLAYRLSTLGFLVLDDGIHNGNYWISDCIAGLQWVQQNIMNFGGDPSRVTIFGESAGADTVSNLMQSPKAKGLFHGAIMQSYYWEPSIPKATSYNDSTIPILNATGCTNSTDQLSCLQAYNASELINMTTIANTPVVDGTYLTSPYFNFNGSDCNSTINSVPVLFGVNRDEGGVLGPFFQTTNLDTGITDLGAADDVNASAIIASGLFPLGNGPMPANITLDVFNTTTRIYTDNSFRCANQFTAYAGVKSGIFPHMWFYQFNRTYQDPAYNTNGVCTAPKTPSHPYGDPSMEYFKCHAGDLANTFGNVARVGFPARDENDMPYAAKVVDYWTTFARNLNPNPDMGYLEARGYWSTINQIAFSGPWEPVSAGDPMMMGLQWNGLMLPFKDIAQCAVLGYPLDFLDV